ncbi:MAG: SU10 major capsid protein [Phycisphaerales bacterium]
MSFTGKATYSAGVTLPEIAEDLADVIGIVSPYETPLLDHLGDPQRIATSTRHEWLEDQLLPNTDTLNGNQTDVDTAIEVANGDRFRAGDQVKPEGSSEVFFVTAVNTNTLTVARGYGATTAAAMSDGQTLHILGNAALEGDDAPGARFTNRSRKSNYTQIFTSAVSVSGTQRAVNTVGMADELDYQKQERLRELIRDLENTVINGVSPAANQQGSDTVRRSMKGILPFISTNVFTPGGGGFPVDAALTEEQLNQALRTIWQQSAARIDTIVVNGFQKRRINSFVTSGRSFDAQTTRFRDLVSVYESDFGVCRVVLSRWVPADSVLLIDSSRVDVLPLAGRSFHYNPLARTGDKETGQIVGEYTLELRNENAHGVIRGLSAA